MEAVTRRSFLLLPFLSRKRFFTLDETIEQQRAYNALALEWNESAAPAWRSLHRSLFKEVVPAKESRKLFQRAWDRSMKVVKRARELGGRLEVRTG